MKIELSAAGKRFNYDWIFRQVNLEFIAGKSYAITGPNGSGKSTLLQAIGGFQQLSEGKISFQRGREFITAEKIFLHTSLCAPYLDVIEEMTLVEFLNFHGQFKPYIQGIQTTHIIEAMGLTHAAKKQIRYYSSGMKQRVKLAQAFFSDTPVLLLDEPCSNLDAAGIELYQSLINTYSSQRIVIVCSNDPVEYHFCTAVLSMKDLKKAVAS